MAQEYGWRSYWWLSTALSAFTNIWILFFQPETKWDRRAVIVPASSAGDQGDLRDGDNVEDQRLKNNAAATTTTDKHNPSTPSSPSNSPNNPTTLPKKGSPSTPQLLRLPKWSPHEPPLSALTLPLKILKLPIALWGALQFNFTANIYLMLNITQSQALSAPPFNFSPAAVGYTTLAFFVGVSFSLVTAGPLSDSVSNAATLRNEGGVREAEMRLPALVPFAGVGVVGCVVVALGFEYGWPWEVVVVVGFGFVGVHVAGVAGIVVNYVVSVALYSLSLSLSLPFLLRLSHCTCQSSPVANFLFF